MEERALLLDLDGTLLDSAPDIAAALDRHAAARGTPGFAMAEVHAMIGDGVAALVARAHAARGLPAATPADVAAYLADYEANASVLTRPFPGVAAALGSLAAAGWRLAVCTNKPERPARAMLERWDLLRLMVDVAGGDSFAVRKPDPGHLLATLERMRLPAGTAVMVGDHANDVRSARAAGVAPVFAAWGYGRPAMAEGAVVAATPATLPALLAAGRPAG